MAARQMAFDTQAHRANF